MKNFTKEHRNNLSKSLIGRKLSDEHRKNLSEAYKKRKKPVHTEEDRNRFREYGNRSTVKLDKIRLPIITCPHCSIKGSGVKMKRNHFNNCQFR